MADYKMGYCEALIEWSGGGLGDVPTANIKDMHAEIIRELERRDSSLTDKQ